MQRSRRQLMQCGLSMACLGLVPGGLVRSADARFRSNPFTLGVASGYPEPGGVVLWTRLAPEPLTPGGGMPAEVIAVDWEVSDDERFGRIRRSGRAYATPEWAHSVHVEVDGLEPGRDYWYRFTSGGTQSPTGRTRAAPVPGTRELTVAVASCQHYESGFYAAYSAMARDDPDLVLHLGDYIYEGRGVDRVRTHDQPECRTLDDYRLRYALYKSDPSLQEAHASCPWMVTWDDHEVVNDYAANHARGAGGEARFLPRRAAAYRAFFEHQPLPRRMAPDGPNLRLYTRRGLGDLAEIYLLDGRQYRSLQACGQGLVRPCATLFEEQRTMLGRRQERWLAAGLREGVARWTVIAQQTVFSHLDQQPGAEVGYWNDGWSGYPAARQRLVDAISEHDVSNPVILSGDIHAFLANDVHARPGDLESPLVAAEFVTTSISSRGPSQSRIDLWSVENPNAHIARSDVRGYTRLTLTRESLRADMVGVRDVTNPDSGVYTLASYDVAAGEPGIAT